MIIRFLHILSIALLFGSSSTGQTPPDAAVLLRNWLASQSDAAEGASGFVIQERAERSADTPFGQRRMEVDTEVTGSPGSDEWDRKIISVRVDGEEAPQKRWEKMEQEWRSALMPEYIRMAQAVSLPVERLRSLRPSGPVVEDQIAGVPCWRFDAIPRSDQPPLERVTFWFEQVDGRLVRTRGIFSRFDDRKVRVATLIATLEYEREAGLDVPTRRHLEGTRQIVRRGRVFTVLLKLDAVYTGFKIYSD